MQKEHSASNVVQLVNYKQFLDRDAGWEVLAGQDVQRSRKVTRYMIAINREKIATDRAAVLVTENTRTDWRVLASGKPLDMIKLFENVGQNNELQ